MRTGLLLSALMLVGSVAHADPWTIDPAHTRVGFSISHMVVSSVDGRFHDVKGNVDLDDKDLTKSAVDLTIGTASVDTGEPKRDEHLKSPDFFDAAKFPNMTFKATKITKAGAGKYKVTGNLTIKDVTKAVTLDVALSEAIASPWGKQVRGVHVSGKLNREDYGLKWNKSLDKGGVVVGDEVTLDIQLELDK